MFSYLRASITGDMGAAIEMPRTSWGGLSGTNRYVFFAPGSEGSEFARQWMQEPGDRDGTISFVLAGWLEDHADDLLAIEAPGVIPVLNDALAYRATNPSNNQP